MRRPIRLLPLAIIVTVGIVALCAGLALGAIESLTRSATDEALGRSALVARSIVAPAVRTVKAPTGRAERKRLDAALDVARGEGMSVSVYDSEAGELYGHDRDQDRPVSQAALTDAVEREVVTFVHGPGAWVSYSPVWVGPGGNSVVVEVTSPDSLIRKRVFEHGRPIFAVILGAVAILSIVTGFAALRWSRRVVGLHEEVRETQRRVEERKREALHDALTALPNRALFRDRLHRALTSAARNNTTVAVMLLDLDRFKEVNDTLGHHHGDLLLKQVGPRITKLLRETDTIARIGGDEFGVVLPDVTNAVHAARVADKIRSALQLPFEVQDLKLAIDASIGISVYPTDGHTLESLLKKADVAMYIAKERGGGHEIYSPERDKNSTSRLALGSEFRAAMSADELIVHYQPKVAIASGRVTGLEALVRWRHPQRGLLPPSEFIPIAEKSGLMQAMTDEVLDQVLRQCSEWTRDGAEETTVAVNLAVSSLTPELPELVEAKIAKFGVRPEMIEFEITESAMMADPAGARIILDRLSVMGIKLAVDDYGTGHSSLAYLKRLPVSTLKIDKSFVLNMASDEDDYKIVQSTIDLAHNLGMKVVAEGVENEDVWSHLQALGCDVAQGYWCGRPVEAKDINYVRMISRPSDTNLSHMLNYSFRDFFNMSVAENFQEERLPVADRA
jgi:diguanylate cyclase (GGDEF)-like protein